MDFDMNAAVALIGRQQIEITVLRERVGILSGHKCAPCLAECCTANPVLGQGREPDPE